MDKFSKKASRGLILRGILYFLAGVVAIFINLEQGGNAIQLMGVLTMLSGGIVLVAALGHKKKQLIWYYSAIWGLLELSLGVYLTLYEPEYSFFVNLVAILTILIALFVTVFSFNAKKKQNYFYLVAIINGAWGFAMSNFSTVLLPYFGLMLIALLMIDGLLGIYGGLLYQSVQEKMHRRKSG